MKKIVRVILVALLFAGNVGLANAQPRNDEKLQDIVNFWELSCIHAD